MKNSKGFCFLRIYGLSVEKYWNHKKVIIATRKNEEENKANFYKEGDYLNIYYKNIKDNRKNYDLTDLLFVKRNSVSFMWIRTDVIGSDTYLTLIIDSVL